MAAFSLVFNSIVWFLIALYVIYVAYELIVTQKGKYPPFVPAPKQAKKIVVNEVSEILKNSKKTMTILDPGCGIGTMLIPLAKKFTKHNFAGIEWSYPYYLAKLRSRKLKNIKYIHDDMFKQSFADADIIICFLIDKLKHKFVEKVIKEVKNETIVISVSFEMPMLNLSKKIPYKSMFISDNIYVYKVENKLKK